MGIHGLMRVISDNAPGAIKENTIKNFFGRKICIDASMSLYQFLIAVRPDDTNTFTLTNDIGETTRTIRMVDSGIKPIYVFDGKPPTLKSGELAKRTKKRKDAEEAATEAKEEGDKEALAKVNKRTVRVTQQHNDDTKKLLTLMGIPYVEAPCEAEAQCAAMVQSGICYGSGSEDMDSLTLGVPLLLRNLNYSESRGLPILEIRLEKVLEGLKMDMDQFIDLCILLGCDYCDSIRGIGPKRALQLIEKHKNIETILQNIDTQKYPIPANFPVDEIRQLFRHPEVTDPTTLNIKWNDPDQEGLVEFLVKQKGFSEERVLRGVEKLKKAKHSAVQGRITSFFSAAPKNPAKPTPEASTSSKKGTSKSTASTKKGSAAKATGKISAKSSTAVPAPVAVPTSSDQKKEEHSDDDLDQAFDMDVDHDDSDVAEEESLASDDEIVATVTVKVDPQSPKKESSASNPIVDSNPTTKASVHPFFQLKNAAMTPKRRVGEDDS